MSKKRKKHYKANRILPIMALVVLIGIAAFGIYALLGNNDSKLKVSVYCLNSSRSELVPETRYMKNDTYGEMTRSLLTMFNETPKNKDLVKAVPDNVKILNLKLVNDSILEVEFSNEYLEMSTTDELFFRSALVWTMTELDFIKSVHIFVDKTELITSNGKPLGPLTRDNVLLNPVVSPSRTEFETIVLYFADEMLEGLVPEERVIVIDPNVPIEEYICKQLVEGPLTKLYPTIPPETKVRNARTDEGICYVNLSSDFINKHAGGSTLEELTIYSVVNSLTELSHIKKVQFLIESEKVTNFKGNFELSKPFERKEDIILQ